MGMICHGEIKKYVLRAIGNQGPPRAAQSLMSSWMTTVAKSAFLNTLETLDMFASIPSGREPFASLACFGQSIAPFIVLLQSVQSGWLSGTYHLFQIHPHDLVAVFSCLTALILLPTLLYIIPKKITAQIG